MEEKEKNLNEASWSWAAQISSYCFWGLLIYFILFIVSTNFVFSFSIWLFLSEHVGLESSQIQILFTVKAIATLNGFFLAWIAIRTRNHYILFLYSTIVLIGILLVSFTQNLFLIFLGSAIIGLCSGAIALTIPSIIAGGRGGAEMFVVAFGIVTIFETISGVSLNAASLLLFTNISPVKFLLIFAIPIILGMGFLIPVHSKFFYQIPPIRGISLSPQKREPILVALLCFVPFYSIYWLYKLHGEIRSFTDSSKLLSPRAAAWSIIFIPFLLPMMLTSLNDCLNKVSSTQKVKEQRATWVIVLWSILFYPVSFAFIQSDINKLIKISAQE